MQLTNDAYTLIMACSYVGLDRKSTLTPLTLKEWNTLAQKIVASELQTPGNLSGFSVEALQSALELSQPEAERLTALLDRGGAVGLELEKLESAGIEIVTRTDGEYPQRLKENSKHRRHRCCFMPELWRLLKSRALLSSGRAQSMQPALRSQRGSQHCVRETG